MDVLVELAKILLPAAIVLYAMYLTMKSILEKDLEKKMLEYKIENSKTVLPMRLQAYERMCLFLERIIPNNLIVRLNEPSLTAKQFQQIILNEIREEFNHNLSQQVYMSIGTWDLIKNTVEDVIALVNTSSEKLKEDAKSVDLAKEIFANLEQNNNDPVSNTLAQVKAEIQEVF
jgi:hypothetical protein